MKSSGEDRKTGSKGFAPIPYIYKGKPYNNADELEAAVIANPPSEIPAKTDKYKNLASGLLGHELVDGDTGVQKKYLINIFEKLPKRGLKSTLSQLDNIAFQINGKPLNFGFDMNEMRELYELLILGGFENMTLNEKEITLKDINDELNRLNPRIVDERDKYDNKYIRLEKLIFDYEADFSEAKVKGDYLEALNICTQAIKNTGNHKDLILLERWMNRQEEIIELAAKEVFEKLVLTGRYDETLKLCQIMYVYTFNRDQSEKLGDNYVKLFDVKKNVWEQRLNNLIEAIAEKLYENLSSIKDYKRIQELCLFMMKVEKQREDRSLTRNRTNIIKITNYNSIWGKRHFNVGLDTYFKTDSE